jgi:predicted flap endonuclease-1-like 5' DNA nuclease
VFYLAGQILGFVLVAMLLGAGLAWFFLIGPMRRRRASGRAAGAVGATAAAGGDPRPAASGGQDESGGQGESGGPAAASGAADAVSVGLAAALRRKEDAWALERAELTTRLDAAEAQAAESEQRVAVAERQVAEAERRVAEIEYQLGEIAGDGLPRFAAFDPESEPEPQPDDEVAAAGAGRASERSRTVAELARETARLREALVDAESRAAKFSSRLVMARTEAEDAQRHVAAVSTMVDLPGSGRGADGHGDGPADGAHPDFGAVSCDNLKEIVGIGPVLETRLHSLGIVSFRQIADMGDADVDRLAGKLDGFGDRIVSDDWVGQARDLQARMHGSGADLVG